jgi:hypothetical protein
MRQLDHK